MVSQPFRTEPANVERNLMAIPIDNPHEFRVEAIPGGHFIIVNERGNDIGAPLYLTFDGASDAIGEMIADDEADRKLNRHRHEQQPDEPPTADRFGASYGANSAGRS